jgi:dTDP-4-amino-4,6-dideoxygalactose transaminase
MVSLPVTRPYVKHAWHIYTILLNDVDRTRFASRMRQQGIGVNVHYIPIYKFSYYRQNLAYHDSDYPVTEDVFSRIVTLPLYPGMGERDVSLVVDTAKKVLREL